MNSSRRKQKLSVLLISFTCYLIAYNLPCLAGSCGLTWSPIEGEFPYVDFNGDLRVNQALDFIDIGELKIPISLVFLPSDKSSQGIFGPGWSIPLFESRVQQIDDNTFSINLPDGKPLVLKRNATNPKLLESDGFGWLAEITPQSIELIASCGIKLRYVGGRLTSARLNSGKTLTFDYANGILQQILGDGSQLVSIVKNNKDNSCIIRTTAGENKITITKRPLFEEINGTKVVSTLVDAVDTVEIPDGSTVRYEYPQSDDFDHRVTLQQSGFKHDFSWNSLGKVTSVNGKKYAITLLGSEPLSVKIEERHIDGKSRSWAYDESAGTISTKSLLGDQDTKQWFMSGHLKGQLRREIRQGTSGEKVEIRYIYDENGNLIRILNNDMSLAENEIPNSAESNRTVSFDNGSKMKLNFNQNGALVGLKVGK